MFEELQSAGLRNVQVWNDGISFEGAKARPRKLRNRFSVIDVGEIEISTKDGKLAVSYRLRFKGLLLLTAAFSIIGFWLLGIKGDSSLYFTSLLWLAFSWLVSIVGSCV